MINFKDNYKRIFAFGCSYTSYIWPTWAQIIAKQYPDATFYNMGKSGSGNLLLQSRLMQTQNKFKFHKDDLILVMYPSYTREDRYTIDSGWLTLGNVYNHALEKNHPIAAKFYTTYGSYLHYLIRDMSIISMVENFIDKLPCDSLRLLSANFFRTNDKFELIEPSVKSQFLSLIENYDELLTKFPKSLEQYFLENYAYKGLRAGHLCDGFYDGHPTPLQILGYLDSLKINLNQEVRNYVQITNDTLLPLKSAREIIEVWGHEQITFDRALAINNIL